MTSLNRRSFEIFFSYSHKDQRLRDQLETQLSLLKREGLITSWYDHKITAGNEWAGKIDEHLNTSQIILLLISANFMASDYCYDIEMTRALERHEVGEARVIPVILRPVDWKNAPFGKLKALPTDGKPVTKWTDRDSAFFEIAKGIRKVVKELTKNSESTSPIKESQASSSPTFPVPIPSFEIDTPSDIPETFIKRLKDAQKSSELGAIIVLAHKNDAGEEIHLLKKQKVLRSLNTPPTRRSSLPPGLEIVKSSIVTKYSGKGYILYAATFGDIEPDDYLVCMGQIDNLCDRSRRRGAGVRADEVFIVDFD